MRDMNLVNCSNNTGLSLHVLEMKGHIHTLRVQTHTYIYILLYIFHRIALSLPQLVGGDWARRDLFISKPRQALALLDVIFPVC